jgi:single-strand DNA-binding protein
MSNGTARANVSVAVNRRRKSGEEWVEDVSYFDITIWGKTAENLKPYLLKGKQIAVDGHLKQDRWEKEGQKFSKVSIVADSVQLLGGNNADGGSPGSYSGSVNAGSAPAAQEQGDFSEEPFDDVSDIPF